MARKPQLAAGSHAIPEEEEQQQQPQDGSKHKPQKKKEPAGWASAVSGALSGMLIGLLVQPLDVIGTRMKGESALGQSRNVLATTRSIVKSNGFRGLWQGSGPSVVRMGLGVGLHMVLVDYAATALTKKLEDGGTHLSSLNAALAGAVPRALATILLNPITIIKTRMEYSGTDAIKYRNTMDAFVNIARAEGFNGLFRGLIPTILTNAPASGIYYMLYTRLREQLASPERPQILINFTSGLVAAVGATVATQPFDVIRTRVQLARQAPGALAGAASLGAVDALKLALKQHGPASLLVGTLPRVMKRTAQTALVWTLYEELLPGLTAAFLGAAALLASHKQKAET